MVVIVPVMVEGHLERRREPDNLSVFGNPSTINVSDANNDSQVGVS